MTNGLTDDERTGLRAHLAAAEQGLLETVADLDDAAARAPSGLPGWSRGHLAAHLARNAETLVDVLDGVRQGEIRTMYGGSVEARNAAIEAGSGRPAAELRADVAATGSDLHERVAGLTDAQWSGRIRHLRGGQLLTVEQVVAMRWQEVEIHRVDLDLGYRPEGWPAAFVDRHLPAQLERLPSRAPGVEVPEGLAAYDVLAWLYGRGRPDLPELPPWP